ncbi:MAG: F0F1 ATP synthase subunit B [Acidobacteria bacterium]|nr:F0F1 ATP synthase subunit B [Acidobacteriota bacterium]
MITKFGIKTGLLLWVIIGVALTVLPPSVPPDAHGINPWEIAQKAFNILLLIDIILFFAGGSLKNFFSDREKNIKETLETAEKDKEEYQEKVKEINRRLETLDDEISEIIEKARKEALDEKEAILSKARNDAERLVEMTRREIEAEYIMANKELKSKIADLAIDKSRELVTKNINSADQKKLVKEYIQFLKEE